MMVAKENARAEALQLLMDNGYTRLDRRFAVGQIEFDIPDVLVGPTGTLTLALVIDSPTSREESGRTYWLVQRLVRALDSQQSRLSVTTILLGKAPEDRLVGELQTISRVLFIDESLPIRRSVAPLLKLDLTQGMQPLGSGLDLLNAYVETRAKSDALSALVSASRSGEQAVKDAYRAWINAAIVSKT